MIISDLSEACTLNTCCFVSKFLFNQGHVATLKDFYICDVCFIVFAVNPFVNKT